MYRIENSARVTFCLSKLGSCVVISSQISSKFVGEVVFSHLCIPHPLAFLVPKLSVG